MRVMSGLIVSFVLEVLFGSVFLWVGMKFSSFYAGIPLSSAYCSFVSIIKVCFVSSLCLFVPMIGVLLSWIALFYFLKQETEARFGELLIMVLVSKVSAFVAVMFLLPIMV